MAGTEQLKARGFNYSSDEDCSVTRASIQASENAITGSEQKSLEFCSKVHDAYNGFKSEDHPQRTLQSVKSLVKLVSKSCVQISACFASVKRSKPTFLSEEDLIRMATAIYNGKHISRPCDDVGKPFKFIRAWQILRNHENFNVANSTQSQRTHDVGDEDCPNGSLGPYFSPAYKGAGDGKSASNKSATKTDTSMESKGAANTGSSNCERPVGRCKAKEGLSKQDATRKKVKIAAEAVKLQLQRNAALDRHNEILLFSNALKGVNEEETLEYFCLRRQEAIWNALRRQKERDKERQSAGSNVMSSVLGTKGTAEKSTAFTRPPDLNPNNSGAAANSTSRQSPVVPSVNEGSSLSVFVLRRKLPKETMLVGLSITAMYLGIMFPGEVTETGN